MILLKRIFAIFTGVMCLLTISVSATAVDVNNTTSENNSVITDISYTDELPDWLPKDAPKPDPNSEIVVVDFNVNPSELNNGVQPTSTVHGNAGSATIYWVNYHRIYWAASSNAGGSVTFKGAVSTNTGKYASASGHGTKGVVDGQVTSIQAQRGKTTKASLTGVMVSSKGLSFTLPGVSSSIYRK